MLIILRYHLCAVRNYLKFRLDKVTIIELVLFCGGLGFYLLRSFLINMRILAGSGQEALWTGFFQAQNIGLLLLLSPAIFWVRTQLRDRKTEVLLSLPIPTENIAKSIVNKLALAWLLLLPIWVGIYFCMVPFVQASGPDLLSLLFYHLSMFFLPLFLMTHFFIAWYDIKSKRNLLRPLMSIIIIAFSVLLSLSAVTAWKLGRLPLLAVLSLGTLLALYSLVIPGLVALYRNGVVVSETGFTLQKRPAVFHGIYLLLVPPSVKPLVAKDTCYFSRRYITYPLIFWSFILVMSVGIWRAADASEGLQWFLFLCITAGYVFGNYMFKFCSPQCESWAQIRALPVKATTWWHAKFWNGFTPVLWIAIAGSVVLWVRHVPPAGSYFLGLLVVLAISATLIYLATNFSLHAYPYSRYAGVWYNLYIITAILFFTILLFPPLAIGFLLFGYLSIFLVLKRINRVDIVHD